MMNHYENHRRCKRKIDCPCRRHTRHCSGPTRPFLSSYLEAVGQRQEVGRGEDIVFDVDGDYIDIAGNDITVDASGTIFTIHRPGLYHVEWSLNLESARQPVIVCLLENGEPSSALSSALIRGNYSSGALINVEAADLPFTLSLHNFGGEITINEPMGIVNTAASIRILRFADGPTV